MSVRNLPLFPEHVFPINTPRPSRESSPDTPVVPVAVEIEKWWALEGKERVEMFARAHAGEMVAEFADNISKSLVHRNAHDRDVMHLSDSLTQRDLEIQKLQAQVTILSENLARFQGGVLELRAKLETAPPDVPVQVRFTPLEWVLIFLSLGLYKPTKPAP